MNSNLLRKIGILSVSMLTGTIAAINGNISYIAQSFPNEQISTIELISTLPSLTLIISLLTCNNISKKIGMKKTVLIGTIIVAVFGTLPFVLNNIYLILISRALLGFGTGLFNSLLVMFVNKLFVDEERTTMIGWLAAMGSGGGIIVTFISGQLLKYGWQYSFLSYLIGVLSFILFLLFVPDISSDKKSININNNGLSTKIIAPYLILLFFACTCYMVFGVKISSLILEGQYGSSQTGSYVIMALCIGSLICGTLFGKLVNILKSNILPIGYILIGISMFLLSISKNEILTILAGALAGFGNSSAIPYILNRINNKNMKNLALCSSLVYVAYNFGSFISPYSAIIIQFISPFYGVSGLFLTLAILWLLFALLTFLIEKAVNSLEIKEMKVKQ